MNTKKKTFTSAPLPFMGQKRKFLKQFKPALKQYPDNAIYVDLFGGSHKKTATLGGLKIIITVRKTDA